MNRIDRRTAMTLTLVAGAWCWTQPAWADEFDDTIAQFRKADESAKFFSNAYGYAVFPKIIKGAVGIGGARGSGRVYRQGKVVGDSTMTQVSVGFQMGGEGFSQIIFFENQAAFDKFTSGSFEFSADASAVAIKAGANAKASTTGTGAGATAGGAVDKEKSKSVAAYQNGMAIFTATRGGLMYEVSVAGQKYSFKKR